MGYHLQAKQKAPKPRHPQSGCHRLRRFDIYKSFLPASFALARQIFGGCAGEYLLQLPLAAYWTDHPSVLHVQFTTAFFILQPCQPLFL
jgi:hypothetical protein